MALGINQFTIPDHDDMEILYDFFGSPDIIEKYLDHDHSMHKRKSARDRAQLLGWGARRFG